ncbi:MULTISPECIES: DEAD/DEAH box helicase [unclassified Fusibacter]|uniref:DEAD/DEAH box helicase n=1 Tax=unclassified Fusibacter TaxID=2624464 RepID=UPI0013E95FE4|nr:MULTISPECIES: DEAD/DEAH box helicase [unclassified Fusibacter]MCK8058041.1 DEAD/DEAH box helicase [Fusibacter sp. A2]NPE20623.1 DEAD/DEAH box helicase [Fusibacter sp. A1]
MSDKNTQKTIEVMKFKDFELDNQIKRALSELGFVYPLEVQQQTIPKILEGVDLIVQSQTGSGKTAGFAIPICEKIDVELESPQVLVLTPTRELAEQVKGDFSDIGRYKGIKFSAIYGKQPMDVQRKELKKNPHVIVATPGRMMDHLLNKNVKLKDIKYFVIDEADEMLLMGFKDQIEAIIKKMPSERVTLLFSATMPEEVKHISQLYMNKPESIEIESEVSTHTKIEQIYYAVDGLKKVDFMRKMIKHEDPKKCIIFCNTKDQVDSLFDIMRKYHRKVCAVHGGMDQGLRMQKLKEFKRGEYTMLIATDVAARGLHVQGLTHVINYGVPFENENYVHRIGRTGRVDENGIAITMVIPSETARFIALQKFLGYEIPCKGGHVERKAPQNTKRRNGPERYKATNRKGATIQLNVGSANSRLRTGDILGVLRNIKEVSGQDIGKIEMNAKFTNVTIFDGKESIIIKALQTKKIKGQIYRAKKIQ